MVQGFSATNGLTFSMLDRTGGDVNAFFNITQKFLAELNQRPEIATAMTSYNSQYPQYMIDVNVANVSRAASTRTQCLLQCRDTTEVCILQTSTHSVSFIV